MHPRVAAFCLIAACLAGAALAPRSSSASTSSLCGFKSGIRPARYDHVIVIMDENTSYGQVIGQPGSAAATAAPFVTQLAAACGLATNYHGITHPSHPNYMAATSGIASVSGTTSIASIFSQVHSNGRTWRAYNESMPAPCQHFTVLPYKVEHNPGVWYQPLGSTCVGSDLGGTALDHDLATYAMPSFAFITPDQCDNMHLACNTGENRITVGDAYLQALVSRITQTPGYLSGRTVVFITWDEGADGQGTTKVGENCLAAANLRDSSCHVATLVLSAWTRPGTRATGFFSHYSLLKTSEMLLGFRTRLGHAGDPSTNGMRTPFGLS